MRELVVWPCCMMLAVAGCASTVSMEAYSAGMVGCLPEEVQITNDSGFGFSRTWQVHCRGRSFFCSASGGENERCVELKPAVPSKDGDSAESPAPREASSQADPVLAEPATTNREQVTISTLEGPAGEADMQSEPVATDVASPRGWVYPVGTLFVQFSTPTDTDSPLGKSLGLGLELMGGLSPVVRGGIWADIGLGGVRADAYGERFDGGSVWNNRTLRGGLRVRVTPVPLGGVLPFLDASAGLGGSSLTLMGDEVCTTNTSGQEECEREVEDEVAFGGTIVGLGGGVEIDLENTASFNSFSPNAQQSLKVLLRCAYSWYHWEESDGVATGEQAEGGDSPRILEVSVGATFW